jgi:D-2-hydroxyacid dehydrogenase (NADP+)
VRVVIMDGFADAYAQALIPRFPEVEFLTGREVKDVLPLLPGAQVLMGFAPWLTGEMIAAAPRLEWLQALTTGVDNLLAMPELGPEVTITTARGIHAPQMSEMAFLYMLALSRNWRGMQANQTAGVWERRPQRLLWRRTVAIVGLGAIADGLARRAKAFDMRVVGVTEWAREVEGFDAIYARRDLTAAVADADFVVVLTPYSPATHHMIDAAVLEAMRPDAYLINIARGGVVDEAALLAALDAEQIAGAGLDVFAQEPLPADAPWWRHPKVLLTPHVGGMSDVYEAQVMPILEHNLDAFLSGRLDDLQNKAARPRPSQG